METWFLIMAMYAGGTVRDSLSLPVQLGPMPSMEVCLDVAQAMERAGKGRVMAGCSIQYEAITTNGTGGGITGGPWCKGHTTPDPIKGCPQ
jgi:hypothetical protein